MSLDITRVAAQINAMAEKLAENGAQHRARLAAAAERLGSAGDPAALRDKVRLSRTSFLLAAPLTTLDERHCPAGPPAAYSVIAADGSHIDVDRNYSTPCSLINIGTVRLDYGAEAGAWLDSRPRLLSDESDLVIAEPGGAGRVPVKGPLLGIKRDVEECAALAALAAALPPERPALALADGTLIRWNLTTQNYEPYVIRELLDEGYLKCLSAFHSLCAQRPLGVASYISSPGGEEVVNTLRLTLCPYEPANCDRCCGRLGYGERPCDPVSGVSDAELFGRFLAAGERSAIFESTSKVIGQYYGEHRICFFYLRLEDEIARVELPVWLATDPDRVGLIHTLVLEQVKKGHGYPVALSEAHEQAVVTGADREVFYEVIDAYLADRGLASAVSAKSFSKKARWI
ncbi:DNA double-strand break repair nuclease NurA [Dehalogenimonas alkenigignens]|uniref:NurA domain protein n=1 Tax=Dehalogenimonas alkenigignens TaxID=1217799 RepID=A0A0W0GGD8_9CHLR|nr:DNA double-strand break repair nuclease NurA [Dehalogenimonas alkenigignens]KTB47614.1 NurA domain protein [Dehalogenimonas alkenigignens]PVV82846.1 nuclease [Dehalogenimonas alkenigignens]